MQPSGARIWRPAAERAAASGRTPLALDRELIRQIRALDPYDLRRLQILVQGMLVQLGEEPGEPAEAPRRGGGKVTYRLEPVTCGKPGCSKCPHGPYWYAYWREGDRVRSRYIGRKLTPDELKVKGVKPVT